MGMYEAVVEILKDDATVASLCAYRRRCSDGITYSTIAPLQILGKVEPPYIYFATVSSELPAQHSLGNGGLQLDTVELTCVELTAEKARILADAVVAALSDPTINIVGTLNIRIIIIDNAGSDTNFVDDSGKEIPLKGRSIQFRIGYFL